MGRAAMTVSLAFGALGSLAACSSGPVPLEQAERECWQRAWRAERPRGELAVGASNRGSIARLDLEISSDYLAGRDPAQIYDQCVFNKSGGLLPSHSYHSGGFVR